MASRYHRNTINGGATPIGAPPPTEGASVPVLRIDGQGRIVIPLAERRRLGLVGGDQVELIPTAEGLLLEPRREATIRTAADGLPVLQFTDGRSGSTEELLAAIDADREAR